MTEKRLDFISAYERIVYDLRKESEKLIQKYCISCELVNLQTREIDKLKKENEDLKQQLVDVTKSIDSLCNRVDKSNRSNEFKWGAIMGLRTLQRELKGDGV